ncbi:lipocalin-like domain-containing protein [Streptosporangium sp. NPDC087985]|uniref:lipocalin-like domain-containing protein n=1 Tax=Streptosporangium sp. NPDC087985 TaxID=3366196 RepID=UPI0037FF9D30
MTITNQTTEAHDRRAREEVRRRLLGAWELVSYTATSADGHVIHPLGANPHGLIVYTSEGYVSAQLGRSDRPRLGAVRLEEGPAKELARAAATYVAYAGTFQVVDPTTVEHHVIISLFPNWVGRPQVRTVHFDGDLLKLSLATQIRDADRIGELTWRRL